MVPAPITPLQNALVIVATFLVAGSLIPWSGRLRLACAATAIGIVLCVLTGRLRTHTRGARNETQDAVQSRIDRIRADRATRMGRRR